MEIEEAIKQLVESESFRQAARTDGKLRVFASRLNRGIIKSGAAVDMLVKFGYEVHIKGPRRIEFKEINKGR